MTLLVELSDDTDATVSNAFTVTLDLNGDPLLIGGGIVAPSVINYPPFFSENLENQVIKAGESLLYAFPSFLDLNPNDFLIATLDLLGSTLPSFITVDEKLRWMRIAPGI